MDEDVSLAVDNLKKDWDHTASHLQDRIRAIEGCGKSGEGSSQDQEANALHRLHGAAQDALAALRSMQSRLHLLAQRLPTLHELHSAQALLHSWKDQYQKLHMALRNANFQAKANIKKAAQQERELLFGGGEESTIRRRNLQTKVGLTSAAGSITKSLCHTHHMMVEEVERSSSTQAIVDQLTGVLKKAESEYKGHKSLLGCTHGLLSTTKRQDVIDRVILVVGFLIFVMVVLYVVSKRIGVLKL